jgi:hypothetical protein
MHKLNVPGPYNYLDSLVDLVRMLRREEQASAQQRDEITTNSNISGVIPRNGRRLGLKLGPPVRTVQPVP